jgi:glutathione synthase/RimK-type ligase-like ATP-grasp enzyme
LLVLVSNREDLTADWFVLELERRGESFLRLCTEDYPTRIGVELEDGRAALRLEGRVLDASEITAVWWRRSLAPIMPGTGDERREGWAAGEALVAWEAFWRTVEAHWVNRPEANVRASCKPIQLSLARRCGLRVPPTLVTNEIASVRAFSRRQGHIICKPLHDGSVQSLEGDGLLYTQRISNATLDEVPELGPEPYLFQAFIEKVADIRVTVVGGEVFACRIDSQSNPETAVDWRRGSATYLDHQEHILDEETSRRLRLLTETFGLRFAAIDLAVEEDGRYVFFEINPNGQWAWVEQITGQPIAAALADELL